MSRLNIIKTQLFIGAEHPVRLLHVTDSHLALADEQDDADLHRLANARAKEFDGGVDGQTDALYREALAYARDNQLTVVHTGDLIDFMSHGNFAYLDRAFDGVEVLYAAGNHDFCHYVGRAVENADYKWTNMKKMAPHIRDNLWFDSRVIGGVNLITLDDSYYLISDGQTEMLRAEAAKGLPMVLFMHVPLFTPRHADDRLKDNPCAYLTAAPEDYLARYPEDRRRQQTPDAATLRAVDYIKHEPLIKAIFAGHTHDNFEEALTDQLMQYTTDATYHGFVREILLY